MIPAKYTESDRLIVVTWSDITANEPCETHIARGQPILTAVQAEGTWGNATVQLLGSLSNVSFVAASDMKQEPIAFSDNAAAGVLEPYIYWKPSCSGNTETAVSVTLAYWVYR